MVVQSLRPEPDQPPSRVGLAPRDNGCVADYGVGEGRCPLLVVLARAHTHAYTGMHIFACTSAPPGTWVHLNLLA